MLKLQSVSSKPTAFKFDYKVILVVLSAVLATQLMGFIEKSKAVRLEQATLAQVSPAKIIELVPPEQEHPEAFAESVPVVEATPTISGTVVPEEPNTNVHTKFQVTYYNVSGITKSGEHTEDGVTCAVDPEVIPLGSTLKITLPDGTVYERKATDTGKAIKGKIIDIYMSKSTKELRQMGRIHNVTVEVLEDAA